MIMRLLIFGKIEIMVIFIYCVLYHVQKYLSEAIL